MANPKSVDLDREIPGPEEAQAKIALQLMKIEKKNIKAISELDVSEIPYCAMLNTLSDNLPNRVLRDFTTNFLQLRVSKDRKGRMELALIASGAVEEKKRKVGLADIFQFR